MDHLAPVWRALPPERRGRFYVPPPIADHAAALGLEPRVYNGTRPPWGRGGPIVVASSSDYKRSAGTGRQIVYMSHGSGQAFDAPDGRPARGYAGGAGRREVSLFLATNAYQAERWRRAYPRTPCEVIGCPKLDQHTAEAGPRPGPVCVSFHWPCTVAPEAGTAWPHYRGALLDLAERFDLVTHAHPRATHARQEMELMGLRYIEDFDEVLATASVYVNDCSSTLYEFAAVGGPVVVLNSPTFRRSARHGGRFWDWADVGPQVEQPDELPEAIALALADPPSLARRRREVVAEVYPHRPGAALAARYVEALLMPQRS